MFFAKNKGRNILNFLLPGEGPQVPLLRARLLPEAALQASHGDDAHGHPRVRARDLRHLRQAVQQPHRHVQAQPRRPSW